MVISSSHHRMPGPTGNRKPKDLAVTPLKRKRAGSPAHSTDTDPTSAVIDLTSPRTVPTKTYDGGEKPKRIAKKPALKRASSSGSVPITTDIPWPDHFKDLEKTFQALSLTYTFFCARKHLTSTFDNIKNAVNSNAKIDLTIKDAAQIKALLPQQINFTYVDEEQLQVHILGVKDNAKLRGMDEDVYERAERMAEYKGKSKDVLIFEFIDGDLKRQVIDPKTGEPTKAVQKLRREELKMPVYSIAQMQKWIEKRNEKFSSAVNGFLNRNERDGTDPVASIEAEMVEHIPSPGDSGRNTPRFNRSDSLPSAIPKERKSVSDIIKELRQAEWYVEQIVQNGHRVFDPEEPVFGQLDFLLSQNMVNALYNTKGITSFYSHQAEAINSLYKGQNVIVATSTSSGKSLIYQLPVLNELERDNQTRAMYIFPTKALAQDQRRSMKDILGYMAGLEDIICETFDGDTPMADRDLIRQEGRIIFTNPDMLHITILPHEEGWRTFIKNLRFVVVDELHVYNGLFGSHMAYIMRRLRRVCESVGNTSVRFVSCSATVANPETHMRTIFGVDNIKLIDFDGSPSGRKEFVFWNTPLKDPKDAASGRGDTITETANLFCQLILRGVRTIAFCRERRSCELLVGATKKRLQELGRPEVIGRVMGYRGGYTPPDRRRIETEMFQGRLMGIVATTALELGIDIGALDAVISMGFPYTIANLRQQAGRAGRRNRDSLAVLVGNCFPTDQHFMANPDEIFTRPNCELTVDLTNMLVLEGHVQCAAYEMPIIVEEDTQFFPKNLAELCEERLIRDGMGAYHCNERFRPFPSRHVAIRDTEDGHFAVVDVSHGRNVVLEEVEPSRAFYTIYEGGIYQHQGNNYLVRQFDIEGKVARVEKVNVEWTTQQRDYTDIDPVETEAIRQIPGSMSRAFFGAIKIVQHVYGFFKLDKKRRILDAVAIDNPLIVIHSKGLWIDVPKQAMEILTERRINIAAAIHAAEHAILSLMPTYVISMPMDVKTECKLQIKEFAKKQTMRKRPARLTFYDAKGGAGGCGISSKAFEFIDLLLEKAENRIETCKCESGCMECCCSETCKDANIVMSKAGAGVILKVLLGIPIDIDALPWGPEEEKVQAGIETVRIAEEVRPRAGNKIEVVMIKREEGQLTQSRRDVAIDVVTGEEEPGACEGDVTRVVKEEPLD